MLRSVSAHLSSGERWDRDLVIGVLEDVLGSRDRAVDAWEALVDLATAAESNA